MASGFSGPASAFLTPRLLYSLLVIQLMRGILAGQTKRAPEALLKEAESLHRAGKLEQAIENYRLFLKQYPDVAPVRSNLGRLWWVPDAMKKRSSSISARCSCSPFLRSD